MNVIHMIGRLETVKKQAKREIEKLITESLNNNIPVDIIISGVSEGHDKELLNAWGFWGMLNASGYNQKLMGVITMRDVGKHKGNGHLKVAYSDIDMLVQ